MQPSWSLPAVRWPSAALASGRFRKCGETGTRPDPGHRYVAIALARAGRLPATAFVEKRLSGRRARDDSSWGTAARRPGSRLMLRAPPAPSRSARERLRAAPGAGVLQAPSRLGQRCCFTSVSDTGGVVPTCGLPLRRADAGLSAGATTALLLVQLARAASTGAGARSVTGAAAHAACSSPKIGLGAITSAGCRSARVSDSLHVEGSGGGGGRVGGRRRGDTV